MTVGTGVTVAARVGTGVTVAAPAGDGVDAGAGVGVASGNSGCPLPWPNIHPATSKNMEIDNTKIQVLAALSMDMAIPHYIIVYLYYYEYIDTA